MKGLSDYKKALNILDVLESDYSFDVTIEDIEFLRSFLKELMVFKEISLTQD